MGLKDLISNLDLVQGTTNPVGEMDSIVPAGFDHGINSTLHQDSLPNVPTTSPYQDLDGQDGPQFDNGPSSTLHTDSLAAGGPLTQDLDGSPDPNWFRWEGLTQSPFDTPGEFGGDYMIKLLENQPVSSTNSNITYLAGQNTPPNDLDGLEGPQFDNGSGQTWDIHQDSLFNAYTYQHGDSSATVGPADLDANGGMPGQYSFGTDPDSPFLTPTMGGDHMITMLNHAVSSQNTGEVYQASGITGMQQDLGGNEFGQGLFGEQNNPVIGQGKQVDGEDLHVHLLTKPYSYQHGVNGHTTILGENDQGHEGGAFDLDGGFPSTGKYTDQIHD